MPGSLLNAFGQHLVLTLTVPKRGDQDTETSANQPRATQLDDYSVPGVVWSTPRASSRLMLVTTYEGSVLSGPHSPVRMLRFREVSRLA